MANNGNGNKAPSAMSLVFSAESLRAALVAKGIPEAAIPADPEAQEQVGAAMGVMPRAVVKVYEPKQGKSGPGLYLVAGGTVKGARTDGSLFVRLGGLDLPVTPGLVNRLSECARDTAALAEGIQALADAAADTIDGE